MDDMDSIGPTVGVLISAWEPKLAALAEEVSSSVATVNIVD